MPKKERGSLGDITEEKTSPKIWISINICVSLSSIAGYPSLWALGFASPDLSGFAFIGVRRSDKKDLISHFSLRKLLF